MAGDREDELAQTAPAEPGKPAPVDLAATATAAPRTPVAEAATVPGSRNAGQALKTLGRYRIERELGAGGMGIVYAAFDPDLERRVALKLLLTPDGDDAQKQRLLREARAMARLTHPNVVTVHEVGSANGRDYVAMELIEGESLAEWLRSEKRSEDVIISAFLAAGRGLAAAHAAGMVHRDFKPHNILRSRTGRIAVTDFGLAREAALDPFATTGVLSPPVSGTPTSGSTPSTPLAGLTMTGSVLGTPAYMAPEQWTGGAVTPATDQFAFSVAVWEALSGERPFRGDTVEMLRRAVELGPDPLDDSKIPRRLRPTLRRGLETIPSKRWPSMDALLAEMAPPKRPNIALAIGAGVIVVAAILYVAFGRSSGSPAAEPPIAACPEPRLDPGSIKLVGPKLETAAISADLERWHAARAKACALEPTARATRVACLDRVLSRVDVVASGIAKVDATPLPVGVTRQAIDVAKYMIDPAVCEAGPRLELATPALGDALAVAMREEAVPGPVDRDAIGALLKRVGSDACAAAWAYMLAARIPDLERARQMADAEQHAERCSDDRIRAETATRAAAFMLGRAFFGFPNTSKLKVAAAAVDRVSQPDLVADIEVMQMSVSAKADKLGEAIHDGERAMVGYAARGRINKQIETGLAVNNLREVRATDADRRRIPEALAEFHEVARTKLGPTHPTTRQVEMALAMRLFTSGDVATAQAKLETLREPTPLDRVRKIRVRVVDQAGKPVAGAVVTAGPSVWGAGSVAAFPDPSMMNAMRSGTTGSDGELALEVPYDGMMIAQLGDLRSRASLIADGLITLALEPTSRLDGKIDLRGEDPTRVLISLSDKRYPPAVQYQMIAKPKADGSFVLEGTPRTKVQLLAQVQSGLARSIATIDLVITKPVVRDIKIALADHKRLVHVVVRSSVSTPVGGAQVYVHPGKLASTSLDKFRVDGSAAIRFARPPDEKTPVSVKAVLRPGDVVASLAAPPGIVSACALGVPADIDDPEFDRKIRDNLGKIEVRCVLVPAEVETIVVEVPPWPRLD